MCVFAIAHHHSPANHLFAIDVQRAAPELAANLHGREKRALRTVLRTYYYPHVSASIAVTLLRRAIRFAELPWEDTMVTDVLCDRSDAKALLAAVGDDQHAGWQRVERSVGRRSRARILAAHPDLP